MAVINKPNDLSTVWSSSGDLVKPTADSNSEYLVVAAGRSNTTDLESTAPAVGTEVTRGTAKFRKIV